MNVRKAQATLGELLVAEFTLGRAMQHLAQHHSVTDGVTGKFIWTDTDVMQAYELLFAKFVLVQREARDIKVDLTTQALKAGRA